MSTSDSIVEFKEAYKQYQNLSLEWFYLPKLGELNLKDALEPIISKITSTLEYFNQSVEFIPEEHLRRMITVIDKFRVWAITASTRNSLEWFSQNRAEVINLFNIFQEEVDIIWEKSTPYILKNWITEKDKHNNPIVANLIEEINSLKDSSTKDAATIGELKTKLEFELDRFENNYKSLFTKGELLNQQHIFSVASNKYENESKNWRTFIIAIILVILGCSLWFLYSCINGFECVLGNAFLQGENLEFIRTAFYLELSKRVLIRLFILSVLIYILKFAIKNYGASKHNEMINRHKANAFAAAPMLADRVKGAEGQDSIIQIASNEIFTQRKTGYLSKEDNSIDVTNLASIVELFKNLNK
jgi:hypothetical protein